MSIIETYLAEYATIINGPQNSDKVNAILNNHSIQDGNYREWLIKSGGGPIGSEWFDSPDELEASQAKLEKESWSITGFVVGWDTCGNPICLMNDSSLQVEDHHFGGVH